VNTSQKASAEAQHARGPIVRAAVPSDAVAVAELFARHTREHVRLPERDGFVQGRFTEQMARAYIAQRGLVVADLDGAVVGVAAGALEVPGGGPPPSREIARRAGELHFRDRTLSSWRWIMYGPLVIDADVRGHGLARRLYEAVLAAWAGRADVAVAFVEATNTHSLGVHVGGFRMQEIASFTINDRDYVALAAPVPPSRPQRPS
jgi:GNAT superfamily N-acetyltransferase